MKSENVVESAKIFPQKYFSEIFFSQLSFHNVSDTFKFLAGAGLGIHSMKISYLPHPYKYLKK